MDKCLEILVIFRFDAVSPGASECYEFGLVQLYVLDLLEEFIIRRIGSGPSAFYKIYTERIQFTKDVQFVLCRKQDALCLSTVTERGVVDDDPF